MEVLGSKWVSSGLLLAHLGATGYWLFKSEYQGKPDDKFVKEAKYVSLGLTVVVAARFFMIDTVEERVDNVLNAKVKTAEIAVEKAKQMLSVAEASRNAGKAMSKSLPTFASPMMARGILMTAVGGLTYNNYIKGKNVDAHEKQKKYIVGGVVLLLLLLLYGQVSRKSVSSILAAARAKGLSVVKKS